MVNDEAKGPEIYLITIYFMLSEKGSGDWPIFQVGYYVFGVS